MSEPLDVKYQKEQIESESSFYFLDSLGSMVGGLIIGVLLVLILGIRASIWVLVCLLIVNLVMQIKPPVSVSRRRGKQRAQRKIRTK